MGRDYVNSVFKQVNEFIHAVFETLIVMYDPEPQGYLEELERSLDEQILGRTISGNVYYILLVLSRINNREQDKDLRFKSQALANVSPADFGVDTYLLLNENTPLVELVQN